MAGWIDSSALSGIQAVAILGGVHEHNRPDQGYSWALVHFGARAGRASVMIYEKMVHGMLVAQKTPRRVAKTKVVAITAGTAP